MILTVNSDYFLKQQKNQLIFVMVKCVLFAVRTEFLNTVKKSFGFRGLMWEKFLSALNFNYNFYG
jgi:hypothetical protein